MAKIYFPDNADDLTCICEALYRICEKFSVKMGVKFDLSPDEFISVLPDAVSDQHFYCIDWNIEPTGYDTTKLASFMALKLIQAFPSRFHSAPLFLGYICHLQDSLPVDGRDPAWLTQKIPNLRLLCDNLDGFCRKFYTAVSSYCFLKGIQNTARAASGP